ncbi:shikimate dehydrogenase family protein [Methylomonas fluvii]|uniref:shikimate dehydrogenase (NADP(+)) n=1 Tax=Methylomonas fluvii TaxID=1854564 RepID=A0ABR9DIX7_9GAMM|nr:shikimate dehydrogenase [Methylomonas fluvii]MBD9363063.1 shikimate dehydrogenase [Methylomonas fluvii]CAD6876289.1 Shikimate 5-dehydrogenase I alpha (EC 1.1.1.25) [Methylomonas fluvii]
MLASITGNTKILGVIADPVSQARTPAMANTLLRERGLWGAFVMLPMQVSAEGFPAFIEGLRALKNFGGAVVSMPHKVVAANLVDELTSEACLIGAVNVVRRNGDGRLIGTMLDGEGFVAGLAGAGYSVKGAHILLVGAGGAASAIAFALAKHGCSSLCIQNRTPERACALSARVRHAYPQVDISTELRSNAHYDLAINATSLGMKPNDELPIATRLIGHCDLVAECVIAPEMTPLLQEASGQGKVIQTGVPMLAAQMKLMLAFMGPSEMQ